MSSTPPPLHFPRGWTTHQVASHLHTLKILFYALGVYAFVVLLRPEVVASFTTADGTVVA
ncbi:hypothetical protein [Stenotrophomonas bentonitica]|uniref:hypothetical protein n=1 Tax=Stenotrophomonas bentonitica TaxID=1450134 RepID=UPI00345EA339